MPTIPYRVLQFWIRVCWFLPFTFCLFLSNLWNAHAAGCEKIQQGSHTFAYWPSAELSIKRCTCVNNRCIRSKISRYNLDCGRVEFGAIVTPMGSRWASDNYITQCHREFGLVWVSLLQFEAVRTRSQQRVGPSGPPVEQPSRMRKKCC